MRHFISYNSPASGDPFYKNAQLTVNCYVASQHVMNVRSKRVSCAFSEGSLTFHADGNLVS